MYIQTLCNPVFSHIVIFLKIEAFSINSLSRFHLLLYLLLLFFFFRMYPFSNPVQTLKVLFSFHNPVRKNTLVQNLCGLGVHIKFIFWVSQQQWFGKSQGATGFLNMESVHQYLHWRKIEETKRDNFLSLSIAICPCLSFAQWLTLVSISPFVCLSVCLIRWCKNLSIFV